MYKATDIVTTLDEIRDVISGTFESQEGKVIDHVDPLIRAWIERAPYVALATVGADGRVDVSPKGDPAGFVKVVDEKTHVACVVHGLDEPEDCSDIGGYELVHPDGVFCVVEVS